jgi:hypothetical protein
MTRDVISAGPATGAAVMTNLNSHVSRLWDASALPLTAIGGTANAITATLAPPLLAGLVTGMKFTITWAATNTGGVTLSINGATAQPVISASGAALTGGALVAGTRALIEWVGSAFRVLVGAVDGDAAGPYRQTFTASGTWTVPTGYDDNARVLIRAWGGGGGGNSGANGAAGGGGGYVERHLRFADLASSYTVTIGAGGAVNVAGGNTTVGGLITAYGGGGGLSTIGGGGGGEALAGAAPVGGSVGGGDGGNGGAGSDARTIWGGGGGAGANSAVPFSGGRAVWGGGGGGSGSSGVGGTSLHGGNGGGTNTPGVAPAGGGGKGAPGARGEVRIEIGG